MTSEPRSPAFDYWNLRSNPFAGLACNELTRIHSHYLIFFKVSPRVLIVVIIAVVVGLSAVIFQLSPLGPQYPAVHQPTIPIKRALSSMAWFCSGTSNSELINNLYRSGLIKSARVKDAMLKVRRYSLIKLSVQVISSLVCLRNFNIFIVHK